MKYFFCWDTLVSSVEQSLSSLVSTLWDTFSISYRYEKWEPAKHVDIVRRHVSTIWVGFEFGLQNHRQMQQRRAEQHEADSFPSESFWVLRRLKVWMD